MSRYGLGVDVGSDTATAAVCARDGRIPDGRAHPGWRASPFEELLRGLPVQQALTRVGDPTPLYGGRTPRSAVEVLADAMARVVRGVATAEGEAPACDRRRRPAVLGGAPAGRSGRRPGRPTRGALHAHVECRRRDAAFPGGVRNPRFGAVAVYDLGAGTVDTAVVRATADGSARARRRPARAVPWGGRDVDDAVLEHVRAMAGVPDAPPTPSGRARPDCPPDRLRGRKEQLSTELSVRVPVDGPPARESVRLVRADLDELIAAVGRRVGGRRPQRRSPTPA